MYNKYCYCTYDKQSGDETSPVRRKPLPTERLYMRNVTYMERMRNLRYQMDSLDKSFRKHMRELAYELDKMDGYDLCSIDAIEEAMNTDFGDSKVFEAHSGGELYISPSTSESTIDPFEGVEDDDDTCCCENCLWRNVCVKTANTRLFEEQSGFENIFKADSEATHQNVQFMDQHQPYTEAVNSVMDPTRCVNDTNDAQLQNFFSRPVKVFESSWAVGTEPFFEIDPWSTYFENTRVANRLTNYNLLRANLRVKAIVNGNGFYFGRLMLSYSPLEVFNARANVGGNEAVGKCIASQRPKIFIDPTTSTGGELLLPFFYHKNNLSIPDSEWRNMGKLYLQALNPLRHANGGTANISVSIFVWAEDVNMSVLTSIDTESLVPQSGVEDEVDCANKNGSISGPATTVARIATSLSTIPFIEPYALATVKGAKMVASMAKLFGYSRPPVVKDPEPYKPKATSELATTNVPDNVSKLTLDAKQELSIDPRITGLSGVDEMAISYIAKKESWFSTFNWSPSNTTEELLWNVRVQPMYLACYRPEVWATTAGKAIPAALTAVAAASLPFAYWTGSLKYRFQIVCSSFHKGRIKIVYDPKHFPLGTNGFADEIEYNTNYTQIIDLADRTDFTITVGNGQTNTILTRYDVGEPLSNVSGTTAFTSPGRGNGVLGVFVVNELTTPEAATGANANIEINVFVSAGDDFEVFAPIDEDLKKIVYVQQSGEETMTEAQNTLELNAPKQKQSQSLGPGDTNHDERNKVFIGESIQSMRTLLKRYCLHSTYADERTGSVIATVDRAMFPYYRGNVQNAVNSSTTGAYNYSNTTYINYLTQGYAGWRGGIRWKAIPIDLKGGLTMQVTRKRPQPGTGSPMYGDFYTASPGITNSNVGAALALSTTYVPSGASGMAVCNSKVNPHLEWESPFYSQLRFIPGKPLDYTGRTSDDKLVESFRLHMHFPEKDADDCIALSCAAAEDFSLHFWTGMGRIFYESGPPPAPV